MKLWDFKVDVSNMYKSYHYGSINDEIFTTVQVYRAPKEMVDNKSTNFSKELIYSPDYESDFEYTLYNRHSWPKEFPNSNNVNLDFISKFTQIALIGGDKSNRNYPAGGALYMVNVYLLFNENNVDRDVVAEGNVCRINFKENSLEYVNKVLWSKVQEVFIQKECVNTSQFAIVLTVNLDTLNSKYFDIAYKLAQQEAGHIGQNIQLVSQYMNLKTLPLGGFYDLDINNIIGNSQTALYCFLAG